MHSRQAVPTKRSAMAFARGARIGVRMLPDTVARHSSNATDSLMYISSLGSHGRSGVRYGIRAVLAGTRPRYCSWSAVANPLQTVEEPFIQANLSGRTGAIRANRPENLGAAACQQPASWQVDSRPDTGDIDVSSINPMARTGIIVRTCQEAVLSVGRAASA